MKTVCISFLIASVPGLSFEEAG